MRRYPMTTRRRSGVGRAGMECAGHRAYRAADDRTRRRAAATAGNPADGCAHAGTHQPAADIELRIRRPRRQQGYHDASRYKPTPHDYPQVERRMPYKTPGQAHLFRRTIGNGNPAMTTAKE